MVYVVNKKGKPLMPTTRYGKVKRLLKSGKAVVINNNPFTIRLKYDTTELTYPRASPWDSLFLLKPNGFT